MDSELDRPRRAQGRPVRRGHWPSVMSKPETQRLSVTDVTVTVGHSTITVLVSACSHRDGAQCSESPAARE
jgi:hypothetical protein